ncbi:hypothetical protein BL250_17745 [Erwinia sp. OLTSP20]|uniref:hypothetical protein n=1 Tax=unclassified Erwinia TaxID=2622719 RepID=UPI000C17D977|nr:MULTISPECIES: hypothetical protein [unclassified Erwinia]PIJ48047.1 hypothetical protein BV501_18415 [Erwinia sp. OAMSP11]PIJ65846.1 hypothetical protein BK416_17705 [Erwinia sp. OLSSP12]PIJ77812.1 hypothetical protein BLD47_17520 [Erwinia sp. OLCASP19]PIJ78913.1 hypothetical protein BLD46_17620 [Erwinia sp. OLMTSP26]PIJ79347.1 hypothetical protein BLD49_17500 [Erwinia sp. OLMDSP33]
MKKATTLQRLENTPNSLPHASHNSAASDNGCGQGYLYLPFVASDLLEQGLGMNILRHQHGKPLYTFYTPDENRLASIKKLQAKRIFELTSTIHETTAHLHNLDRYLQQAPGWHGETLRNTVSPELFDSGLTSTARLSQELLVLKNVTFISGSLSTLLSTNDKLYILGHGGPGINVLAANQYMTRGHISAKALAEQLKNCGLPAAFRDVRITACYSADRIKPRSFAADELASSAGISDKKGLLNRLRALIGQPPVQNQPFAQLLGRELNLLGYQQIQVSGYHGAGVTFSRSPYNSRRLGDQDIRRSLVRRTFR